MEFKLLKQYDGYSYYENPDKKMVKAIKAISKPDYIDDYMGKRTLVKVQANGNYMLEDEQGNVSSMSKEDYDEAIAETHEKIINDQFDICKVMNDNFMPFQESHFLLHEVVKPTDGILAGDTYVRVSRFEQYEGEVKYSAATSYSLMHLSFTPKGEIKNRDYNHDLNKREIIKTPDFYLKSLLKDLEINKITEVSQQDNNFFVTIGSKSYCYTLEKYDNTSDYVFEIETRNHATGNNYYNPGESSRKVVKGKKLSIMSPNKFKAYIIKEYNQYFSQEQIKTWDNKCN